MCGIVNLFCRNRGSASYKLRHSLHSQQYLSLLFFLNFYMVGDIFNLGTWKVILKIYNLLQPPLVFLILSMDCRAPPIRSTLLTRTYLSVNGVVL